MKIKIFKSAIIFLLIIGFSACELCGLKLQEGYNFIPNPAQPFIKMNAYEFIKGRKNIDMLYLYTVIEKAGIQKWYNDSVQRRTFIVPNDIAMKNWMTSKGRSNITDFTDDQIKDYLMPTICIGEYLTVDLNYNDSKVETLKPDYFVYFRVVEIAGTGQGASDWYHLLINGTDIIKTSNIRATNGVIHIVGGDFTRLGYVPK